MRKDIKILWAPWRYEYIKSNAENRDTGSRCIFCDKPSENNDKDNLIVYRGKSTYIMLNRYPYNNGHIMIMPYRHLNDLTLLEDIEMLEMMQNANMCIETLRSGFNAQGFNLGINIERVAGAGIDEHLHLHVVPRWNGDTNFMQVTGNAQVISQSLEECWEILHSGINKLIEK